MNSPAGRPPVPVEGFGPIAEFALALRALRESAGRPKLTSMARAGRSSGSLSEATKGQKLPTVETTKAFLQGCGVTDEVEISAWLQRRAEAEVAARRFTPNLDRCASLRDLRAQLRSLMTDQGLQFETLSERLTDAEGRAVPSEEIAGYLDGPAPLDHVALAALIMAMGGTSTDVKHWQRHRARIIDASDGPGLAEWSRASDRPLPSRPLESAAVPTADTRRGLQARSKRWKVIAMSVAALVLLSAGLIAIDPRRGEKRLTTITPTKEPPPSPQPESTPSRTAASVKLTDLSRRVRQRREQPVAGHYTYIHRRVWWPNTAEHQTGNAEDVDDIRLWWEPGGSGRRVTTTTEAKGSSRSPDEQWYVTGELRIPILEPSEDPRELGVQLAAEQNPELGAAGRLRALATMNNFHDLTVAQRACVLQLLADTPGLTYRGQYLDRADRAGLAFSADTSDDDLSLIRDTLIFHQSTGILLAHETTTIPDRGAGTPSVRSSTVYLERTHTSTSD